MKKLESTLPNMLVVLTVIALISASALALAYNRTKPILDEHARQRRIQAVVEVVPDFDNEPTEESFFAESDPVLEIFPARIAGERVGSAVHSRSGNGYSGTIEVMVGFDAAGTVTGISVLRHQETPGLGARITEDAFRSRFVGLKPSDAPVRVIADGGEVDAITAATISSRAVAEAVQRAWDVFATEREGSSQ